MDSAIRTIADIKTPESLLRDIYSSWLGARYYSDLGGKALLDCYQWKQSTMLLQSVLVRLPGLDYYSKSYYTTKLTFT